MSHNENLPIGESSFTVSADAGSYVAITVNDEIIGVAEVPATGTIDVPIIAQTATGTAMVVVTRNQRQPYIATVTITNPSVNVTFGVGWNWWSPTAAIELADFEAALDGKGLNIIAQDGSSVTYENNSWSGDLTTLEVGVMYMVQTLEEVTITVDGTAVDPAEHPLVLNPGNNWIGILGNEDKTLDEALPNPTNLDYIKTANGLSVYYQGQGWKGSISTLKPGTGYIYNSKAGVTKTITYPLAK